MKNNLETILYVLCWMLVVYLILSWWAPSQEGFLPKVKEFYRPIERKIRWQAEGFADQATIQTRSIFRKLGIL